MSYKEAIEKAFKRADSLAVGAHPRTLKFVCSLSHWNRIGKYHTFPNLMLILPVFEDGAVTYGKIVEETGMLQPNISKCMVQLKEFGMVEETAEKRKHSVNDMEPRTHPRHHQPVKVFKLTPFGEYVRLFYTPLTAAAELKKLHMELREKDQKVADLEETIKGLKK